MATSKLVTETPKDYRAYLIDLASSQRKFIAALEEAARKHPQLAQDIAYQVAENKLQLKETNERLRGELRRELSVSTKKN